MTSFIPLQPVRVLVYFGHVRNFLCRSLGWQWRTSFAKDAFVVDSGNLGRWTWTFRSWIDKTIRTMYVIHAPVPAAAGAVTGQTVRNADGGMEAKKCTMEQNSWDAFDKSACNSFNYRCRSRRHFERNFFGIVTGATNVEKPQSEEHWKIVFLQAKWECTTRLWTVQNPR